MKVLKFISIHVSFSFLLLYLIGFSIGYIFYRHVFISLIAGLFFFLVFRGEVRRSRRKRENLILIRDFISFIKELKNTISYGGNLTEGFFDAHIEFGKSYAESKFKKSLDSIVADIKNGKSANEAIKAYLNKAGEKILNGYMKSILICSQNGGDLLNLLKEIEYSLSQKLDYQRILKENSSQAYRELVIMALLPILVEISLGLLGDISENMILIYISNTIVIFLTVISFFLAKKIVEIED